MANTRRASQSRTERRTNGREWAIERETRPLQLILKKETQDTNPSSSEQRNETKTKSREQRERERERREAAHFAPLALRASAVSS